MLLSRCLTRAPLGYSAERAPLVGGGQILPPSLPKSQTDGGSEEGEAAIESPRRVLFKQIYKKKS